MTYAYLPLAAVRLDLLGNVVVLPLLSEELPQMPRSSVPSYRLHKASGEARVILDGQHVYLGSYNSAERREQYARLIAERFASPVVPNRNDDAPPDLTSISSSLTVSELLVAYLKHARAYYSREGRRTQCSWLFLIVLNHRLRAINDC